MPALSFSMEIKKHKTTTIGQVEGHNERLHPTKSQLPEAAWITPEGNQVIVPFNADLIKKANSLKTRKDAVVAIELVLQVGNQTDWREFPTEEFPEGQRKPGASKRLSELIKGAKEAAFNEFGKERIVSIALHTDESTPHIHIVFVPIVNEKLQAKKWTNGPAACAFLLKKLHGHIEKFVDCTYTPGAAGGAPHDPSKRAGAVNGPKPEPTFLEKAADKFSGTSLIKQLKASISELNQQIQVLFSKLKIAEKRAKVEAELCEKAIKKAQEMHELAKKQGLEIKGLQLKIEALQPKPLPELETPLKSPSAGFLAKLKHVRPT